MKSKLVFLAMMLVCFCGASKADTVEFPVAPSLTGIPLSSPVDLFSSDLNGTVLSGQTLSLDLILANDVLARIPFVGGFISVAVFTNAETNPGFAGPTTGFPLDAAGDEIGTPQVAGRAEGSNGFFSMGIPVGSGSFFDISGVHFDTTFPATGFVVTNTELLIDVPGPNTIELGTEQQLPEPGTVMLVGVGFALIWRRLKPR
jgi:hypothetical protein